MPLMKRATQQLKSQGIELQVIHGLWGYYLYDPTLPKQTSTCEKTVQQCVTKAIEGRRPFPIVPCAICGKDFTQYAPDQLWDTFICQEQAERDALGLSRKETDA